MQHHIRPVSLFQGVAHTAFAGFYLALGCIHNIHTGASLGNAVADSIQVLNGFKIIKHIHCARLVFCNNLNGLLRFARSGEAYSEDQ